MCNKKSVPVPKSLQTQVTEVRGRWEEKKYKTKQNKNSWRFYLDLLYPKYPYLSYFQHTSGKKQCSSLGHFAANFCSILLTSTELRACKTMKNLAISSVIFFMGPFFLLTSLTQTPVLETLLKQHLQKHHSLVLTRCTSQIHNWVSVAW